MRWWNAHQTLTIFCFLSFVLDRCLRSQLSLHCRVLPFRAWLRRSFHQIQHCGTWHIKLRTLWKLMVHPSAVGWDGTHHRQGEEAQFDQFCAHGHCAGSNWLGHSTLVVSGPCFFFWNFGENVLVILYTVLSGKCWNPHGYHMFVMAGGPVCKCRG